MGLGLSLQNPFLHTYFVFLLDLNWEKLPTLYFLSGIIVYLILRYAVL